MDGRRLLDWHRERAGTVERVHDEVKNRLGGGHKPSQHFAVNATWLKLALLTQDLVSATRGLCFWVEERTVRAGRPPAERLAPTADGRSWAMIWGQPGRLTLVGIPTTLPPCRQEHRIGRRRAAV